MQHLRPVPTASCQPARVGHHRRHLWTLLTSFPLLAACTETLPVAAPNPVAAPDSRAANLPAQAQPLRVIVRFRTAVPYQDAAYLRNLGQQVQAELRYVASVSPDTHVYLLQPQPGLGSTDTLKRLASQPAVLWVERDRLATPF